MTKTNGRTIILTVYAVMVTEITNELLIEERRWKPGDFIVDNGPGPYGTVYGNVEIHEATFYAQPGMARKIARHFVGVEFQDVELRTAPMKALT